MIFPFIITGLIFTFSKGTTEVIPFILYFILYFVLSVLCYVVFIILMAAFVDIEKEQENDSRIYRLFMANSLLLGFKFLNVKLKVLGDDLFPKERFLLVQNHVTMFDPLASIVLLNKYQIGFISKPENKKLFVIGKFMHKTLALPIDRENPRNAVKTINKAADFIKNDICSIGIYPEGTRNKNDNAPLLPFRRGALKVATKADCPIVVTVITGADRILKDFPLKRKEVFIKVCGVIPKETVEITKTDELTIMCRKLMCEGLGADYFETEEIE